MKAAPVIEKVWLYGLNHYFFNYCWDILLSILQKFGQYFGSARLMPKGKKKNIFCPNCIRQHCVVRHLVEKKVYILIILVPKNFEIHSGRSGKCKTLLKCLQPPRVISQNQLPMDALKTNIFFWVENDSKFQPNTNYSSAVWVVTGLSILRTPMPDASQCMSAIGAAISSSSIHTGHKWLDVENCIVASQYELGMMEHYYLCAHCLLANYIIIM